MPLTMEKTYFVEWRKSQRIGDQKLTQKRLSELLGVHEVTVKKWETGERTLPPYIGFVMAAIENGLPPVGADHMIEMSGSGD